MVRQYRLGYVFVDQSASLLSKVAFANSYATLALSQKLRSDVQAIAGAMNLSDEQKEALNTLAVGTAVVRLADEHPEPFLVKIPLVLFGKAACRTQRFELSLAVVTAIPCRIGFHNVNQKRFHRFHRRIRRAKSIGITKTRTKKIPAIPQGISRRRWIF